MPLLSTSLSLFLFSPLFFSTLSLVGGGRDVATTTSPVDVDVLTLGVLGVGSLRLDTESVSTEVITLSLEKVGREILGAVSIKPRQGSREGGCRDTEKGSLGNDVSPAGLSLVDGLVEEVVEEKVLKIRLLAVGVGDILQEDGSDNATSTPHKGDRGLVELPAKLTGSLGSRLVLTSRAEEALLLGSYLLHEHETLSIRDNLGGVESLLEIIEELLLVALKLGAATNKLKLCGGDSTLALDGRQASGQDSLGDQGDWHTQVKSIDGSPLAGTLLASLVQDLLNKGLAVLVVEVHDVAGNLNKKRVKDTGVPLGENITDLLAGETETTLHNVVSLIRGEAVSV